MVRDFSERLPKCLSLATSYMGRATSALKPHLQLPEVVPAGDRAREIVYTIWFPTSILVGNKKFQADCPNGVPQTWRRKSFWQPWLWNVTSIKNSIKQKLCSHAGVEFLNRTVRKSRTGGTTDTNHLLRYYASELFKLTAKAIKLFHSSYTTTYYFLCFPLYN